MSFSSPIAPSQAASLANTVDTVFRARIGPAGPGFEARASLSLLQAAQLAGLEMASSCRNGTCRTCICGLTSGEVVYRIDWPGLSAEEKQEGFILPCVAYPASDVVLELPV
ncbi:MAG: 2Fe-2S iron-sulfur cluster-binding protein [Polaromonas sp.]|uniref:2Fe-2S iron-sulfur cluster-binding protein n=1 Tax=Polaromonas sp. TaxID=1869339 RepID=UPI0027349715|nr:2Fe-2S iron-sulfur cluster-binding protein [Polaromonas sp.]MDP3795881.1 2Fe-2S iron-sulfur cluster-binding protein [Polaromonas sp.]